MGRGDMKDPVMPEVPETLSQRIRLVRRDFGHLLFHFTRSPDSGIVKWRDPLGGLTTTPASAANVLQKILAEQQLIGTARWTYGYPCVCFTEAPITELNALFSLVDIAASERERPRYEPYGIAVSKRWLFQQGGRPVIYDLPEAISHLPESERYRLVPYDPLRGIDYSWEREWRVRTPFLRLDPKHTLVIVPTAKEAFDLVYSFASVEADWDVEGSAGEAWIAGSYHLPRWLAVSLDIFGFNGLP